MNTSYLTYDELAFPLDGQCPQGTYTIGSGPLPQWHHQMPLGIISSNFSLRQRIQETNATFASRHSVESYAAQVHLLTPMAPAGLSGYNREPGLSPSHMNLWPEYDTASWTPPTFPNAAHSLVSDPIHMRHPDSMAETNANRDLQVASWRPTEARPIQGSTNAYNNGHIGNRVPIEHPFAEGIPVSIAGPNASALPTDAQAAISNEVIMMRRGKLHGEGPHICKLDGKAFRHHGDLVRHRKTKPGHAEYQGPVVCVCGQEFSRRDGLYTHLKSKRCRRRPFFSR